MATNASLTLPLAQVKAATPSFLSNSTFEGLLGMPDSCLERSRQQLTHDLAVDIGQPVIAPLETKRQALMVQS